MKYILEIDTGFGEGPYRENITAKEFLQHIKDYKRNGYKATNGSSLYYRCESWVESGEMNVIALRYSFGTMNAYDEDGKTYPVSLESRGWSKIGQPPKGVVSFKKVRYDSIMY